VTPQVPGDPWQVNPANCAQVTSHCVAQQNGSAAQTAVQHAALSQAGLECAE